MFCSCHSDRLFVDQVKWKEPLILSLDFDKLIKSSVRILNLNIQKRFENSATFRHLLEKIGDERECGRTLLKQTPEKKKKKSGSIFRSLFQ